MPIIPPLLDNGELVTDYQCKADIVNNYFASQCTPLDNFDGVPEVPRRTHLSLSSIETSQAKILSIIRALDPNKASRWDNISPSYDKNLRFSHCPRTPNHF